MREDADLLQLKREIEMGMAEGEGYAEFNGFLLWKGRVVIPNNKANIIRISCFSLSRPP